VEHEVLNLSLTGIKPFADDETFLRINTENNRWVSNYGRIVSQLDSVEYACNTVYQDRKGRNRYYYILSNCMRTTNGNFTKLYIHRLVAKVFNYNDDRDLKKEVHHIKKFNPDMSNETNNRADNLVWVSSRVHSMLNAIEFIYLIGSNPTDDYEFSNPYQAFKFIGITDEEFYKFINELEPELQHKNLTIYRYNKYCIEIKTNEALKRVVGSYVSKKRIQNYNCLENKVNRRVPILSNDSIALTSNKKTSV
jgi:hypothetical protein